MPAGRAFLVMYCSVFVWAALHLQQGNTGPHQQDYRQAGKLASSLRHGQTDRRTGRLTDRQAGRHEGMHDLKRYLSSILFVVIMFLGSLKPTMVPSS